MGKINALNILLEPAGKDFLKELYAVVIENVNKYTISGILKNVDLSGDPESGTLVAKRFANSQSREYGTARAAGKGKPLKAMDVTVPVDIDREIIEELEYKDIKLYGVDGVLTRRSSNHVRSMVYELDYAFFDQGAKEGNYWAPSNSALAVNDALEEMLQFAETTQNEYVRGVPRDMLRLVLDVKTYGDIRNFIDEGLGNGGVNLAAESWGDFHGVPVFKSLNLPVGVKAMLMIEGAIAQPVMSNPYDAEKIGLSEAYAVELFYHYGTKVVTPDLIWVWADQVAVPKAFPLEREFEVSQLVTLNVATPDADIYYTKNGVDPDLEDIYDENTNSDGTTFEYNPEEGITLTATTTIKAIASKTGYTNSDVFKVVYTKV